MCVYIYLYNMHMWTKRWYFDLEQVYCAHLLTFQMLTLFIIYSGGPLSPSLVFPLCAVETSALCAWTVLWRYASCVSYLLFTPHPALCTQWLSCVDHISTFLALWLLVGLTNGEHWQEMRGRKESEISSFLPLPPHRTTTGWLSFISVRMCSVVSNSLQPYRL